MKKNLSVFTVVVLAVFAFTSFALAVQDPNDNGMSDTLYLDIWPGDDTLNPPGPWDVKYNLRVTNDIPDPKIDSIAGFTIPLCFTSSNLSANAAIAAGKNNTNVYPLPGLDNSIFRHMPDMTTRTEENWLMVYSEALMGQDWDTRILDLGGGTHFWMSLVPTGAQDQRFPGGSRVLTATMTFTVDDSTNICLDTCFWPPNGRLAFSRSDAVTYVPQIWDDYLGEEEYCAPLGPDYPTHVFVTPTYAGSPCCWQLDLSQSTYDVCYPLVKVVARIFYPDVTVESASGPAGAPSPLWGTNLSGIDTITYFMPPGTSLKDSSQTVYACFDGVGPHGVSVSFKGYDADENEFGTSNNRLIDLGRTGECACFHPPNIMTVWLPFDEPWGPKAENVRSNYEGIHYDGSVVATPGFGPKVVLGNVKTALYFDGDNDHVDVPGDNGYCNIFYSSFTIDAWITPNDINGTRTLVDKRHEEGGSVTGYQFFLYNGRLGLQLACGASGSNSWMVEAKDVLLEDYNYHVAVTVDRGSSTGIVFYKNGQAVDPPFDPTSFYGLPIGNPSVFRVGGNVPSPLGGGYFKGTIDEVELFRRALSAEEIRGIHDALYYGKCGQSFIHPRSS